MHTAFAFDLDGTISSEELLPRIAAELDLDREIETLTRLTLSGAIPFEDSFRLRCAILRAVPVSRVQEIVREVQLWPALSEFIAGRREACFVVTGNLDVWIQPLLERLGCRAFTSTGTVEGDRLTKVAHVLRKSEPLRELRAAGFERVVAIGDSVNDIPMFELADIGVAAGYTHQPATALVRVANYVVHEEEALCRLLSTL